MGTMTRPTVEIDICDYAHTNIHTCATYTSIYSFMKHKHMKHIHTHAFPHIQFLVSFCPEITLYVSFYSTPLCKPFKDNTPHLRRQ